MPDVFARFRAQGPARDRMAADSPFPYYKAVRDRRDAAVVTIDGRSAIMAGTTDYLGLSCDPRVKKAAVRATDELGVGCAGSRLMNGTLELHEELEQRLAAFVGHEAALVTPTGFHASLTLAALFGPDDTVYTDRLNHASLIEGVRLSEATVRRYRHNDTAQLAKALTRAGTESAGAIVTDGVFSMTGDVCDLPGLADLRRRYDLRLVVDGAHDVGVLGDTGAGAAEHFGLQSDVDLLTFSLSKAFGAFGGVVAGPRDIITELGYRARSALFSVALPPACTAAALAALDIIQDEPGRRARALHNADRLRRGLRDQGHGIDDEPSTVIAVPIGDGDACVRYWGRLMEEGVFTNAAVPPAVPPGKSLLRVSATAALDDSHVDHILTAFTKAGEQAGPPLRA